MNLFFIEKEMILLIIPFIKLFHMDREEVMNTSHHRCEQDEAEQHNEKPLDCPFGSDFSFSSLRFIFIGFFQNLPKFP
jgi:hypothetical protein